MNSYRILIVEDDELLSTSLRQLLLAHDYEVKTFVSGQSLLDFFQMEPSVEPDRTLLLMDVHLQGDSGIDTHKVLLEMGISCPIVFMSSQRNADHVHQAWRGGAGDFLFKPFTPGELMKAIDRAWQLGAEHPRAEPAEPSPEIVAMFKKLSPRQKEILQLVASGLSNTQISSKLGISSRTVKMHREALMHRFAFTHVTDLVRFHDACKGLF